MHTVFHQIYWHIHEESWRFSIFVLLNSQLHTEGPVLFLFLLVVFNQKEHFISGDKGEFLHFFFIPADVFSMLHFRCEHHSDLWFTSPPQISTIRTLQWFGFKVIKGSRWEAGLLMYGPLNVCSCSSKCPTDVTWWMKHIHSIWLISSWTDSTIRCVDFCGVSD